MTQPLRDDPADAAYRDYFRRERPSPWPAPPTTDDAATPASRSARSSGSLAKGRLSALVAVALLVAVYLAVASYFPRRTASSGPQSGPIVGHRPTPGK